MVKILLTLFGAFMLNVFGANLEDATCDATASSTNWDRTQLLNTAGTYSLSWHVDQTHQTLTFMVSISASNPQWIGFGISESGHMLGSDIVTVAYSGVSPVITDSWVDWAPMDPSLGYPPDLYPQPDVYTNYNLICASKTSTSLMAIITRALNTHDRQDRVITAGAIPVIYAWGSTADVSNHGANRGSTAVTFFGTTPPVYPPDADGSSPLLFNSSFTLFPRTTQYVCMSFDIGSTPRHMIAAEVIAQGAAAKYVHHVLVIGCGTSPTNMYRQHSHGPLPCQNTDITAEGSSPLGSGACLTLIYGWALGGAPLVLPSNVGANLGFGQRYIMVEVHFNNPSPSVAANVAGVGVNLTTTNTLRQYNGTTLTTGDYLISVTSSSMQNHSIPANQADKSFEFSCSSACTTLIGKPMNIYASFLHMHSSGKKIWLTKTPSGGSPAVVDYRQYWNFGFQVNDPQNYTISPGDKLNLHCSYDSTNYNSGVSFGLDSSSEMCMAFLFYYPAIPSVNFCGYISDQSTCGTTINTIAEVNPVTDSMTDIPASLKFGIASGGATTPTFIPTTAPAPVAAPSVAPAAPSNPGSSSSSSSSSGCFAADEVVLLEDGRRIPIASVTVGDRVLAADSLFTMSFTEVLHVPHNANSVSAQFIYLVLKSGKDLRVTPEHILLGGSCDGAAHFVKASDVKVGSCLKTVSGIELVVDKSVTLGKGIYTFVTALDYIVVNDIVTSPFSLNHHAATSFYAVYRAVFWPIEKLFRQSGSSATGMILEQVSKVTDAFMI